MPSNSVLMVVMNATTDHPIGIGELFALSWLDDFGDVTETGRYTLVVISSGPDDISVASPLGARLAGAHIGDTLTFDQTNRTLRVRIDLRKDHHDG